MYSLKVLQFLVDSSLNKLKLTNPWIVRLNFHRLDGDLISCLKVLSSKCY